MVDEERLADSLSAHIDAMLLGQPLPLEDSPEELRQLLGLADQLAAIDLPPRPAFDQRIKQSLSGRHRGGNGGPTHLGNMPLLLVLGLVALIGVIGMGMLAAILVVGLLLPQRDGVPTATPRAPSPIVVPTPMITPLRPTVAPPARTTATPGDMTQQSPASTRDELMATASPASPSHLVGEPTESHTDMGSGRDSDRDNGGCHSSDDHDEDDDDD
jgi:hypothetical protein